MKGTKFFLLLLFLACSTYEEQKGLKLTDDLSEAKGEKFKQCYLESDLFLARRPGKMEISYLVTPEGRVENEKVTRADFKDANLFACVLSLARHLEYEVDLKRRPTTINYPINFHPTVKP